MSIGVAGGVVVLAVKKGVFDATVTGDDRVKAGHGGNPAVEGGASNLVATACLLLSTEILMPFAVSS